MARIDLRSIPETGKRLTFQLDSDSLFTGDEEEEGVSLIPPLAAQLEIHKAGGRKYIVEGHLEGMLQVRCDRCLENFQRNIDINFRSFFALPSEETSESELELEDEDLDVEFRVGEEIEVSDVIREQVLLDLPMKRICREECKGLCKKCGGDLNKGPCGCEVETGHPAFQKLEALKTKGDR
jgi:uncharacterized protein